MYMNWLCIIVSSPWLNLNETAADGCKDATPETPVPLSLSVYKGELLSFYLVASLLVCNFLDWITISSSGLTGYYTLLLGTEVLLEWNIYPLCTLLLFPVVLPLFAFDTCFCCLTCLFAAVFLLGSSGPRAIPLVCRMMLMALSAGSA